MSNKLTKEKIDQLIEEILTENKEPRKKKPLRVEKNIKDLDKLIEDVILESSRKK
tara:strand:- start:6244 stop:6408 length:165 start_codon:yes stop_codon:yes gene_type:complete